MKTYPYLTKMKLSEIKGSVYNPRKITSEALIRLGKSLKELGDLQPITVNVRTGNTIIGGHQRFKIYEALGRKEIDVWLVDLPIEKEKAANLALNHLSGEFDLPQLKDMLEELDTGDFDIEITGFSTEEIGKMMSAVPPPMPQDEMPEEDNMTTINYNCPSCGYKWQEKTL